MSYTGISYSDIFRLKSSDITTVDGNDIIKFTREKTNELCIVPLLPSAKELINKYKDSESRKITSTLLTVRTANTLNKGIKIIARMSGIQKKVSCHVGRHTFATLSLENKVPIETVSRALGHTDLKTTQIYAKVTEVKMYTDYSAMKTVFSY
jgi:integrase